MSRKDLNIPAASGVYARQAHAGIPEGTYEEELGREGFFGPASHLYHKNPPTGWSRIEGGLIPRAFYLDKFVPQGGSEYKVLLHNQQVEIAGWRLSKSMDTLFRPVFGDSLLFVHTGKGHILSEFGRLDITEGDYVVIPRGTTYQVHVDEPLFFLVVDNNEGRFMLPDKGLLGHHALFDAGVLDIAQIPEGGTHSKPNKNGEWEVHVATGGGAISKVFYPFDPIDLAGWKGDVFMYKLNWRDFRPIASHRFHVPPSAHTTFVGNGFVVCTFAPRHIEESPDALKVPFYHRNIDYDEVLFYHAGNFFSRDHVEPAMVTWHPRGLHHGPHPKALATQHERAGQMTNEVAVMIDTRHPLIPADKIAKEAEWLGYKDSWK